MVGVGVLDWLAVFFDFFLLVRASSCNPISRYEIASWLSKRGGAGGQQKKGAE